ncbi:unnamed protein product [Candidula unifasciata]|uniref:Arrestin C-terminal-like domain-containing protein n=1 Tax=Candidula unifasciata TaxID=100452 RepID=A0A8S3YMB9_9EUPU|nr:unnamed protein product [Candidula unifasciata]
MAGVQCFAILTSDPRGLCWAGGVLDGKIVLNITTPLPVRGIRMAFLGEGRVEWTDGVKVKQKSKEAKTSKTAWKKVRKLRETEIYSRTTTILFGADPESTFNYILPAGNHIMPFELPVPSDLPSSFEGTHGYVRYWLECILDVAGNAEQITKKAFTVISKCNLNTDPLADKEIKRQQKVSVCCACCTPGYYDIRYCVARRGYVPGEKILVDIRARNYTNNIVHLVLRFKMVTSYHAQGKCLRVKKTLQEGEKILETSETLKWNPEIPVPPLPPSGLGGSRVIDIGYWLEVDMYSKAFFSDSLHFNDEIKIGTLPLKHVMETTTVQHGRSSGVGADHLLPVGFPVPESRSLPVASPLRKNIFNWIPSKVESPRPPNGYQVYNGQIKKHSSPSNSSLW